MNIFDSGENLLRQILELSSKVNENNRGINDLKEMLNQSVITNYVLFGIVFLLLVIILLKSSKKFK